MEYKIKFDFTILKGKGNFIGKSGDVNITTDKPYPTEVIKNDEGLKHMISHDMAIKTKSTVVMVNITDVSVVS